MYPEPQRVFIEVGEVSEHLRVAEAALATFPGIATVVLKLFQIVRPHLAVFRGKKDYQQLAIVRRLVRDLEYCANSGRGTNSARRRRPGNEFTEPAAHSETAKAFAPCLYKALQAARKSIAWGERNPAAVKARVKKEILHSVPITPEYFDLVDPDTIRPIPGDTSTRAGRIGGMDWRNAAYR